MLAHEYRKTVINPEGDTRLSQRLWESDVSQTKRTIKQKLIDNQDIRELLDNADLRDTDDYSDYIGENIFPFLLIPDTISEKKNYICFKADDADTFYFDGQRKDNPLMKVVQVEFLVLVHKDNVPTKYGIERHDALATVIKQIFAWSEHIFPFRLRCTSDIEGVTDNDYATRTLLFEAEYPNNLTDTRRKNAYGN